MALGAFRSSSLDDNPVATATNQIGIARPAGVVDGDFLVATIVNASGAASSITPPTGWTLLRRIENGNGLSLAIYTRVASGEPVRWTWGFGTSATHVGGVRAYAGVDSVVSVDVDLGQATASTTTPTTPAVTTSLAGLILVGTVAAKASVSFTAPLTESGGGAPYVERFQKAQTSASLEGSDYIAAAAGATLTASATTSGAAVCITHVLALRPSPATVTAEQATDLVKQAYPPGAESLYDWDSATGSDTAKFFQALGDNWKRAGFDLSDRLRVEANPLLAVQRLPDLEGAYGITPPPAATIASRQAAVLSKARESGASTLANIRAVIEPLLGYAGANVGTLQIIETPRGTIGGAGMTGAHTYADGTTTTVGAFGVITRNLVVRDDGQVSAAGAQLGITITDTNPEHLIVQLQGPVGAAATQAGSIQLTSGLPTVVGTNTKFTAFAVGQQISLDTVTWYTILSITDDTHLSLTANAGGTASGAFSLRLTQANKTWQVGSLPAGAVTGGVFYLYGKDLAGCAIFGTWTVTLTAYVENVTLTNTQLFVEGAGLNAKGAGGAGLGGDIFDWGVVVEATKVGTNPDYAAARAAIGRINPGYGRGHLLFQTGSPASNAAIPDDPNCLPDAVIPA